MPRPEVVEVVRDAKKNPIQVKLRLSDEGKTYNGLFVTNGTAVKRVWFHGDDWMPKSVFHAMLKRAYGIFKKVLYENSRKGEQDSN